MRRSRYNAKLGFGLLGCLVLLGGLVVLPRPSSTTHQTKMSSDLDASTKARVNEAYGQMPMSFEANQGQTDGQVKFLSRGSGYNLFLTEKEAVLTLAKKQKKTIGEQLKDERPEPEMALRMKLLAANPQPQVAGLTELPSRSNYFIGNDPQQWRTNIPTYAKVKYQEVYPGIGLVYYGKQQQLEYDFLIAPGADPKDIKLVFEGADKIELDPQGDLVLHTAEGQVRQNRPEIYQESGGSKRNIPGQYVLNERNEISFHIADYDPSKPLVIDPVLSYSTYLGGNNNESARGIAVDATGNVYIAGFSDAANFPTANPFQSSNGGDYDVFVTKLNPAGSALIYSTYIGGNNFDGATGLAVDASGNAYVTGDVESSNYPVTMGAFQTVYGGKGGGPLNAGDAFVTKLNASGSALIYSTYLGGIFNEQGNRIAVDASGNAYVMGQASLGFPTTAGAFQPALGGSGDVFVTKMNAVGSTLVYSTYLGGSGHEAGRGLVVDSLGNAYVMGGTNSSNFPTTAGVFQPTFAGGSGEGDGFVTKLNPSGSALVYSTYLGGSAEEQGTDVAIDAAGNAYAVGFTQSTNFPTMSPLQATKSSGFDSFVTKLNATGTALVYSTYLGGFGHDQINSIVLDSAGNACLIGNTSSSNFPVVDAFQTVYGGGSFDAFVTKLNSVGSAITFSSYLGGSGIEIGYAIAADNAGNVYVTGDTGSTNFPTANPFQAINGGGIDAFVSKIASGNQAPIASCQNVTVTADASCNANASINSGSYDPDGDALTITQSPAGPYSLGTTDVILTVTDSKGASSECYAKVTVNNPVPTVTINSPASGSVYAVGMPVNFTGSFTDNPGTHTATWMFDALTQAGTVNEMTGAVSASYSFTTAGVYKVKLTVNDSCGGTGTATTVGGFDALVVIYDPNGGFVTGGGWITSPPGAYTPNPALTGKANFGFVSKYPKGATVPTGQTEFQIKIANLNFQSISYDWLVVAGARAQYKGTGTINGAGTYSFLLTAIDGQLSGGGNDRFRIKIWDTGGIIYDNQIGVGDNDNPTTTLGGGNIVIHK